MATIAPPEHATLPQITSFLRQVAEEAAGIHPRVSEIWDHLDSDRTADAVRLAEALVAAHPEDVAVWMALSVVQAVDGDIDQCLRAASKAADLDPTSPYTQTLLGLAYEEVESYDKAIRSYERALRSEPSLHVAGIGIGTALLKLERVEDAVAHLEKSLKAAPDIAGYRDILALAYLDARLLTWTRDPNDGLFVATRPEHVRTALEQIEKASQLGTSNAAIIQRIEAHRQEALDLMKIRFRGSWGRWLLQIVAVVFVGGFLSEIYPLLGLVYLIAPALTFYGWRLPQFEVNRRIMGGSGGIDRFLQVADSVAHKASTQNAALIIRSIAAVSVVLVLPLIGTYQAWRKFQITHSMRAR